MVEKRMPIAEGYVEAEDRMLEPENPGKPIEVSQSMTENLAEQLVIQERENTRLIKFLEEKESKIAAQKAKIKEMKENMKANYFGKSKYSNSEKKEVEP